MQRVIFVTHQIPWSFKKQENEYSFEPKQSHLSQFAGSQSLAPTYELIYVGYESEPHSKSVNEALWKEKKGYLVEIDPATAQGHYEGYCKSELWPLFHYILWDNATNGVVETKSWFDYEIVNQKFAEAICELYQAGDIIWIQDYHLVYIFNNRCCFQ
jgi:trehalose 6-phosphate synthase/phosphatase